MTVPPSRCPICGQGGFSVTSLYDLRYTYQCLNKECSFFFRMWTGEETQRAIDERKRHARRIQGGGQ